MILFLQLLSSGFLKSRKKKERSKKGKSGKEDGTENENKVRLILRIYFKNSYDLFYFIRVQRCLAILQRNLPLSHRINYFTETVPLSTALNFCFSGDRK